MIALVSLILVFGISLFTVRMATIALVYTGLSKPVARFQALSAWTGTGYTTSETENIVDHPVRRKIVSYLMVARSVGLVAVIAALAGSFVDAESWGQQMARIGLLLAGVIGLIALTRLPALDHLVQKMVQSAMQRLVGIDARDFNRVLHLEEGHAVDQLTVEADNDWLADRTLAQLRLRDEGVVVIAVEKREGKFVSAPDGDTLLHVGDTILVYGRAERLAELDSRRRDPTGEQAHKWAIKEQEVTEQMEDEEEQEAASAP